MRETILLFFFISSFLFISGAVYYFFIFDKRLERRINFYLDFNKKYKKSQKKKVIIEADTTNLRKLNEIIRETLSGINQEKTEHMLKAAGVVLNSEEYIMIKWFVCAITGGIAYFLFNNLFLLFLGGFLGYKLPNLWISRKRKQRLQNFNEGLPDMISTIIGSLRSGYSFTQALKTVYEECDPPIKDEISFLMKELSCGITMEEALKNLNERMESNDLELMIQAVLIQRQVGGNLAGVLEIIVGTIRERNRIQRQVQTLTSQGRLSGRVIGALPVVLGFMIYVINPEYIKVLFNSTLGIIIISIGITSGIIGFILIHKLTKIEV